MVTLETGDAPSAFVPDGQFFRRPAPAGPLGHVGVADVEVGDYRVALSQAEEPAHVFVVGDGAGAPHGCEAQRVGRELHVLDGAGAGCVVLEGLDLVAAGLADHSYHDRRAEGLLALAADPAGRQLLALPFGLGLEAGDRPAPPGPAAPTPAPERGEPPRPGWPAG